MAHESLVFGYIQGSRHTGETFRMLQKRNMEVIKGLPWKDDYPYLSRAMFGLPPLNNVSATFRTQVIHFGSTVNYLELGHIPEWLEKFESLLMKLYWVTAEAHIIGDFMGHYRYRWKGDPSIISATYWSGSPQPTTRWERTQFSGDEPLIADEFGRIKSTR